MGWSMWRNEMSGSAGNVVQAGSIGSVTFPAPARPAVVPAEAAPPPAEFVDREEQLALLRGLVESADGRSRPAVVALRGMPGVGKTALQSQVAATSGHLFTDGVLSVVFEPRERAPSEAVARILRTLGMPDQYIPAGLTSRVAMYRSMTAGRRLLVLLDDVTDAEQVTALLPNSPASMVLAAGNRVLEDLFVDGAVDMELPPLAEDDGVRLLATVCGAERVAAEPDAARELVMRYDGLPLAIGVAGARLAARPAWSVRRLIEELAEAVPEREPTEPGLEPSLEAKMLATFDVVYADLPEPTRRLYRALGVMVGVRFGAEVLAATCERPEREVKRELDVLHRAGLIEEQSADVYRVHRAVRRHALLRSDSEDDKEDRRGLRRRAVDWWLFGAMTADIAIDPGRLRVPDPERVRVTDGGGVPAAAALEWLDHEHANLLDVLRVAADEGWHAEVCRLFEALFALYKARKPLAAWVEAGKTAVLSAAATERADTEARCRCLLAKAYQELEHFDEAHRQLTRARELVADGPPRFTASTYDFTGNVYLRQQDFAAALDWFSKALEINRRLGLARGTALQSMLVGRALGALGRFDEALEMLTTARELVAGGPAEALLPKILASTGAVLDAAGRDAEAERVLLEAVERADAQHNTADAADALVTLTGLVSRRGEHDSAEAYRERAVLLLSRMGSPQAARLIAGQ